MTGTLTPPARPRPRPHVHGNRPRHGVALAFLGALVYQTFHQVEHAIETVQLRLLHHPEAHTLIGGLDFEWVHLAANAFLMWALVGVAVGAGPAARAAWQHRAPVAWTALWVALTVQGYHVAEHLVRIGQYLAGAEDPPGLVTTVLEPVWFHFAINLTVLVGMAVAFFGLGVHRDVLPPRPGPRPRSARSAGSAR